MPSGVKDIQLLELKDTISQLNKTISTQNELISSLQKMLEERNAKDSEKDLLIANLQSQLAYLKNKVFGSTSEIRHDQLDGQLNLFGTPVGDEKPAEVIEPEVISVKGYTKERKPKATYDDKYNSVRSICKHFFTDIVGLSIKFFCVSLRHMSIAGGSEAVAANTGDDAPGGTVLDVLIGPGIVAVQHVDVGRLVCLLDGVSATVQHSADHLCSFTALNVVGRPEAVVLVPVDDAQRRGHINGFGILDLILIRERRPSAHDHDRQQHSHAEHQAQNLLQGKPLLPQALPPVFPTGFPLGSHGNGQENAWGPRYF